MTAQRSFKRLVRSRMGRTGESYTAARAMLLAAETPTGADAPALATSDEAIRERTGRGWEEWFDLLDEWGAVALPHRDIARWVAGQLGVEPLAWGAQAITISYERARGGRPVGQHPDGFAVTASKTVAVPVEQLFDAFVDESSRDRWIPAHQLRMRTATKPKSARFDWVADHTRVNVIFDMKQVDKGTVFVEHVRLADAETASEMKAMWRSRLTVLKAQLEGGGFGRNLVLATVVAGVASAAAVDTWSAGLLLGLALWIGFPVVLWAGAMFHEHTHPKVAAIHAGDWLVKLLAIAVVVSLWR